jgi:hypothetical protein
MLERVLTGLNRFERVLTGLNKLNTNKFYILDGNNST